MNAPKGKPVICEELARNDVDRLGGGKRTI